MIRSFVHKAARAALAALLALSPVASPAQTGPGPAMASAIFPGGSLCAAGGNDSFTKVLLHLDGTNGASLVNPIPDVAYGAALGHNWAVGRTATYGAPSPLSNGVTGMFSAPGANAFVSVAGNSDFRLMPNPFVAIPFTIDMWVNPVSATLGQTLFIAGQTDSGPNIGSSSWIIYRVQTNNAISFAAFSGSNEYDTLGTTALTGSAWHHVAVVRTGGTGSADTLTIYIDGVANASSVMGGTSINDSGSNPLSVGRAGSYDGKYWNSGIEEFRISVGVARWTSNFTPPSVAYCH